MLLLVFQLGADRFALDAAHIREVLPLVGIRKLLGAPAGICGTINYRGRFVPVADLSEFLLGRPAEPRLSTRIVLADVSGEGGPILLGLVVEKATETLRALAAEMVPPAIIGGERPWRGPTVLDARGFIQLIEIDKLLAEDARRSLVARPTEAA